jgi:hypothetical protein
MGRVNPDLAHFLQNRKKGKPGEMDLLQLKNDITRFFIAMIPIYSETVEKV